jgi:hypothetical protein
MMDGEAPKTCWDTYKRQVINLWNCCILLVDLFELYDDARTCEHQIHNRELGKANFSHVGSSQILMTSQVCQNSDVTMGAHYKMLRYSETAVYHVL